MASSMGGDAWGQSLNVHPDSVCVCVCVCACVRFQENVISFLCHSYHSAMLRWAALVGIISRALFWNDLEQEVQADSFKHFQR